MIPLFIKLLIDYFEIFEIHTYVYRNLFIIILKQQQIKAFSFIRLKDKNPMKYWKKDLLNNSSGIPSLIQFTESDTGRVFYVEMCAKIK